MGDVAQDFKLHTVGGRGVQLSSASRQGPVVLVVLRGFPVYQCPVCSTQVGQFLASAEKFKSAGAKVLLVYPGPADGLKAHADDFALGKSWPEHFELLLDPDYAFTRAYRLRWDAPRETAYPATFVLDRNRKVLFAKVSTSHGGRATADEVLQALAGH